MLQPSHQLPRIFATLLLLKCSVDGFQFESRRVKILENTFPFYGQLYLQRLPKQGGACRTCITPAFSKINDSDDGKPINISSDRIDKEKKQSQNRRSFLSTISILTISPTMQMPSHAIDDTNIRKPWAPIESLLPATRVRLLIQQSIDLTQQLITCSTNEQSKTSNQIEPILTKLTQILSPPLDNSNIQPNKSIRLAFNTYTAYLRYDDRYTLNVSPKEKKSMVREDRLPDVKQVITADLDLRDLYRNLVIENVDEARAELRYLLNIYDKGDSLDGTELLRLLKNANDACDEWFGFIGDEEVKAALNAVLDSEES